eukprot:scaffold157669_cov32-Attheya_sp.AAC.1
MEMLILVASVGWAITRLRCLNSNLPLQRPVQFVHGPWMTYQKGVLPSILFFLRIGIGSKHD